MFEYNQQPAGCNCLLMFDRCCILTAHVVSARVFLFTPMVQHAEVGEAAKIAVGICRRLFVLCHICTFDILATSFSCAGDRVFRGYKVLISTALCVAPGSLYRKSVKILSMNTFLALTSYTLPRTIRERPAETGCAYEAAATCAQFICVRPFFSVRAGRGLPGFHRIVLSGGWLGSGQRQGHSRD